MLFANQRKAKENKGEELSTELNLIPINYSVSHGQCRYWFTKV